MRRRKVLFLIESLVIGGAEKVLVDMVGKLDPSKFEVTVCSVFKHSVYDYQCVWRDLFPPHVKYRWLVNNDCRFLYKVFNWQLNHCDGRLLHRVLIGGGYDVEVAWYEGLPTSFLAHSSNRYSRKLAWLHYGNAFLNLSQAQKDDLVGQYRAYDQIVGVAAGVCRNFEERLATGFPLTTCYNPVDEGMIEAKSREHEIACTPQMTFVFVGRLVSVKGLDRLVRVCKTLRESRYDFRLWIVGDGELRETLESDVQTASLGDCVTFLGNHENPYPYMAAADWLVLPSYAEAFSVVLMEAMVCGTPVVATQCAGTAELIGGHSEYGMLAENSEEGLLNAMRMVLDNPGLCSSYAVKAKERMADFSQEKLLKAIEEML